jgi:hypothetical protein
MTQILTFLTDYYCHSGRVPNDDVEAVSIVWLQLRESLETGEPLSHLQLLVHWSLYLPHLQDLFGPDGFSGSALLVVFHVPFHARNPTILWGWSSPVHLFVLYTLLSDPGRWASVDVLLRSRRDPDFSPFAVGTGPAWPMRLIQVHVCCMYAFSATRFDDPGWLPGEMLYRALADTRFARLAVDWGPLEGPLTIGTYAVFVLEPPAPLMPRLPRVRAWWAVALLAMHAGLELPTTVGRWGYMMAVGLVPCLPPDWVARPFDRLAARRLARAGAVAA